MSVLSDIASTIRKAIYGKDMREAIAKGFENVDQIISSGEGGGLGGGFIMMDEDIPVQERKKNVLYAKNLGTFGDITLSK